MHKNDQATFALSKVSTELHAEPSACCPCGVDEALCDTPKYAESWQPSFLRLHAARIGRDMHSVEIDCILADHDDAFASKCTIAAEEDAKTQGALENTSAAAAAAADSQASSVATAAADGQASPLLASSPAQGIDAGFFKSYAQHIKAQRSILCKTLLIQQATSTDCEDDLDNRLKLRRGRTRERVQR
jgi:hypothetical protein